MGSHAFVEEIVIKRLEGERRFWDSIPWVPDLQCAWQILLQCVGPRCHHMLRTLPLGQSREPVEGHGAGREYAMSTLLEDFQGMRHLKNKFD